MVQAQRFSEQLEQLTRALSVAKRVLITAPGAADGDSIGSQLALRRMILERFASCEVSIVNDEPLPERYLFLPDVDQVHTPETLSLLDGRGKFDVAIIVDGGIDRAGRLRAVFERTPTTAFIDHHAVSVDYPYTIRIVEPTASSTTELVYHLSQTRWFASSMSREFSEQIYLGLIFDTGFFRHSNTTPEALELGAKLLRTGFDFTRVGERGMLERSFSSLQLLSHTLSLAKTRAEGRIIWSTLSQETLKHFNAVDDDREGIIDHLFLTQGTEVAILFFEQVGPAVKLSMRSQGRVNVATFARSLTERGGGHARAAGALIDMSLADAVPFVLERLENALTGSIRNRAATSS